MNMQLKLKNKMFEITARILGHLANSRLTETVDSRHDTC